MALMNAKAGQFGAAAALSIFILTLLLRSGSNDQSRSEKVLRTTQRRLEGLSKHMDGYEMLNETVVYNRYANVYDRVIKYPDGQSFSFDVWGRNWKKNSFAVVIIVPFNAEERTVTLVKEYNVAHHKFVYGFPTGMVDPEKHRSPLDAARQELDEEAALKCNNLINLLNDDAQRGIPQDKYQRESIYMYLCVDEEDNDSPNQRDSEESDLYIEKGVTVLELKALLRAGTFQSNNVAAAYLALDELSTRGYRLA
mmetsp:Transcript_10184/g.31147  ORF Transcript_10184/g.31147 Transcript_10184/m.31147 type:complete len:253 (+) Transcript_10184:88-846(+)|eukprot:CAMPEP_0198731188 /NCGR_PEP_ID=MMETSP1475-20131203/28581_1 /TAXON_ID= ORGANISM="Unidentified sp., Strain CCMP1999" /NCGR_SAMPLE_ID=MMETSP1475 /ASSEMBLY_ACC=CAM_ASM_001111 /LENGTH=252 /DNA_ID=CAMNT_0044494117 /DNA_START=84 /DNA_END=842 /DNA_ORIENTATION=-